MGAGRCNIRNIQTHPGGLAGEPPALLPRVHCPVVRAFQPAALPIGTIAGRPDVFSAPIAVNVDASEQ